MERHPVIALDLMGGDKAPSVNIQACVEAIKEGYSIMALGTCEAVDCLRSQVCSDALATEVCQDVVLPDEPPVRAIRTKPFSSIRRGLLAVKENRADAFVSGGSTGALVAGGVLVIGRSMKVEKPCLATVFPSRESDGVLFLDLGAAADVRPSTLVQFAHMGSIYAKEVMGRDNPKVFLLNIGTEPEKGSAVARKAYELLGKAGLNFCGNIEAREVFSGVADVVVADGFTGNVFLKTCEGASAFQMEVIKREISRSFFAKLASLALRPAFRRARDVLDYTQYGGAPLLGLTGCVIKCHGSSNALAVLNGIRQAARFIERDVARRISNTLDTMMLEGEGI